MTFADWIDQKTPKTLSVVLSQREGTIRMWKNRNVIPRDCWPDILTKLPEIGLTDLLAMENASRRPVSE